MLGSLRSLCARSPRGGGRLENLARYLHRPPLAERRLRLLPADQVALAQRRRWISALSAYVLGLEATRDEADAVPPPTYAARSDGYRGARDVPTLLPPHVLTPVA